MVSGRGLGLLSAVLRAQKAGREAYVKLQDSPEFQNPLRWPDLVASQFDGLVLPGGHAPGMKEYLESRRLQSLVVDFFASNRPVGAICHGVVLAARSRKDGRSVLHGRRTTALLRRQELTAWALTRLWMGSYYRTYSTPVEDEVRRSLACPEDFLAGPLPILRDTPAASSRGFTVLDGNYLSARWPGDAHAFGLRMVALLT